MKVMKAMKARGKAKPKSKSTPAASDPAMAACMDTLLQKYIKQAESEDLKKVLNRVHSKWWHSEKDRLMKNGMGESEACERAAEKASAAKARFSQLRLEQRA